MKYLSMEFSEKGQVIIPANPLDSLALCHHYLRESPKKYSHGYVGVPRSMSTVCPTRLLGWAAFFQGRATPLLAAKAILETQLDSAEELFNQLMDNFNVGSWRQRTDAMIYTLENVYDTLTEIKQQHAWYERIEGARFGQVAMMM